MVDYLCPTKGWYVPRS